MDGRYCFTDITVGWPGSVHNARVFSNSEIFRRGQSSGFFSNSVNVLEGVEIPVHIIGDPAYPLLKWLMKPYSDTGRLSTQQSNFNYRLSRARNVVENAFGRLKGRWRCLLKRNDCTLELVKVQVAACCILHNICKMHGVGYREEWSDITRALELPQPSNNLSERSTTIDAAAVNTHNALSLHFSRI